MRRVRLGLQRRRARAIKNQMSSTQKQALDWMMAGDIGISNKTIVQVLEGTQFFNMSGRTPQDLSDFGRCYRLLATIPAYRLRLGEVVKRYPSWQGVVARWSELEALYVAAMTRDTSESRQAFRQLLNDASRAPEEQGIGSLMGRW